MKNVGKAENEVDEKVEETGLKKESREAEGMGLLQWQRKWGGSPEVWMSYVVRPMVFLRRN